MKQVLFEGDQAVGVEVEMQDGTSEKFFAKVVVDATGQRAMLSNKFRWRVRDPKLKKAVLYSYFKGAHREPDLNGGATLVLRTEPGSGGWFWYIPLEDDITSVGIVADPEYLLKGRGQDLAKIFQEEIEKCGPCFKRVSKGERVDKIYSILDYSYRSKENAGNGFILIGDAYGFLDPIYSSGVLLALKMAELAADAIHDAFRNNDFSAERLGQYQPMLDTGIESMRKLVHAFYSEGFSFSQFLKKYPEQRVGVINLLIGNVERYWGRWRAGYTLYNGRPEGSGSATSHRVSLDRYYDGERSRVGVSGAWGREVENQGPPLPERMRTRLFESMVSIRPSGGDGGPHLGLGLYLVRLIAAFHGGQAVARDREDGDGVQVAVTLPLAGTSASAEPTASPAAARPAKPD